MKRIIAILMLAMVIIGAVPFVEAGTKIVLTTYMGIPLVILTGSVGMAFLSKRFEAIITGIILSALWPVIAQLLHSVVSNL